MRRHALSADERVLFFATDAARTATGWEVPVHAWVHAIEPARKRKAILGSLLERAIGREITGEARAHFDRRVGLMCADNRGRKRVVIEIAGQEHTIPPTASNGHSHASLHLDAEQVARHADGDRLPVATVLADGRRFEGSVRLVPPTGLSIISDIDDTLKITDVLDKAAMLQRTFLDPFVSAPGMPELVQRMSAQGALLHVVSSSPWHLYEPLEALLDSDGFPPRSMSLKMVRVKDASVMNLVKKGTETKPAQILPILKRFPERRFVLLGDSGEQDPEVYGQLLRRYPDRVQSIWIRNVDASRPSDARYRSAFEAIDPGRWSLFTDPTALEELAAGP